MKAQAHGQSSAHDEQNAIWSGERSDAVAAAVRAVVPAGLTGLDYGCGPGHIGLRLRDHFASLSLVDASADVIAALADTVAAHPSLRAIPLDLTVEEPPERVDCVVASMSFHHVRDTAALLDGLARAIVPGGWLVVVDFDADHGELHAAESAFEGYDGFDRAELAATITAHGFEVTSVTDVWSGQRWVLDRLIDYTLFMIVARRSHGSEAASCDDGSRIRIVTEGKKRFR